MAGIGFQLSGAEDEVRPEREAAALIEDAASLLFVTDVMRGEAAGPGAQDIFIPATCRRPSFLEDPVT